MFDRRYGAQVRLLLRRLPEVARHDCFALKGGTAINLFLRDLPRVSVDIDLTYLPLAPRAEALREIESTLLVIEKDVLHRVPGASVREHRVQGQVVKLTVATGDAVVKLEPNLILRGSVHPPEERELCAEAQQQFAAFVRARTLSVPDLFGGKLCAALDRQHPRDLFDVQLLLEDTGITPAIRRAFVVYLAGHERPMHELLAPRVQDVGRLYEEQFRGMTRQEVSLERLHQVQRDLPQLLTTALDHDEREFLLSLKRGEPEWSRLGVADLERLPSLQWKLLNIRRMDTRKRHAAFEALEGILGP
ncbi:MAG: nucleotidyl transferase AbiEii/AbiGii toxin family protein [Deferrisomatales bacterium]